ncbi:hypothetical protein AMAG_11558 [Allomyces macrogynus ATCC 38327]|uniref:SH3 domain-containing protein n=1 Tax=Allomyces macrogynus (strain ATCC 38327) TaxID=578462 RepID=A0A0L0SV14_ALLM3|nr:hypothetical protein AMAG_11558 [Allomyces macrogynus ATCC 38327]|eukprot:KNE66418.1 hypothetical protein AMAG_11558 [Allomyces macrogynus ATCC 38327]
MVAVHSRPARARPRSVSDLDVDAARNDPDSSSATAFVHHKIRPMTVRSAANPHRVAINSGRGPAFAVQAQHAGTVPQAQLALPPTALTADAGTAAPPGLTSAFQDSPLPAPRSDEPSVPWGGVAVAIVVALVIISGCVVLARIRRRGQQNQAAAELATHAAANDPAASSDAGKTKVENVVASHEHLLAGGASPDPPMAVQTTGIPVHPTGMPVPPLIGMPLAMSVSAAVHPTGVAPPRPVSVHSTGGPAPWNMPVPPTVPMMPLALTPPPAAPIMLTGPHPPPMPVTAVSARTFVAVHSYVPQARDELPLRVGDRVAVVVGFNDGWAKVVLLATGEQGFVPMTLVVPEDTAAVPLQVPVAPAGPVYTQRYASLARGGAATPLPPPGAFPRSQ